MLNTRKKSFWTSLFKNREDRFTIEELGTLHMILESNPVVHEGNKDTVIEALRSVAELMIWGDQHDGSFFEFFAEHQTLSYVHKILSQEYCRGGEVAVQILQSLSILTQNIQSEQAIYYLFSNNHINNIISQDFNFEEDEVLGYYISFLKTISLKLNNGTIQFFFQRDNPSSPFQLYTRAVAFFRHEESMVRAAVRTATLNIYSVQDEAVRQYLKGDDTSGYIRLLGMYVVEQCISLHAILPATANGTIDPKRLDVALEELDDIFYYCNDVYQIIPEGVGETLMLTLWDKLQPILLAPFEVNRKHNYSNAKSEDYVKLLSSLFIFERIFHILRMPGLLNAFFAMLFLPKDKAAALAPLTLNGTDGALKSYDAWEVIEMCLKYKNEQIATAIVRFLLKIIQNTVIDDEILEGANLLPRKRQKSKKLLNQLTSLESEKTMGHLRNKSSEELVDKQLFPENHTTEEEENSTPTSIASENPDGMVANISLQDDSNGDDIGDDESCNDPVGARYLILTKLLDTRSFMSTVNYVGWILFQLLPLSSNSNGSQVPDELAEVIEENFQHSTKLLKAHFNAPWCDGLALLLFRVWSSNRVKITSPLLKDPSSYLLTIPKTSSFSKDSDPGLSTAIAAAQQATDAVNRFVAIFQIRSLLENGELPLDCPLHGHADEPIGLIQFDERPLPIKDSSEVNLERMTTMSCKVAFTRGAERNVFFCSDGRHSCPSHAIPGSVCIFLADAEHSGQRFAKVVAMAPLAGAEPAIDPTHPSWLHLRVRPPLSALLIVAGSGKGSRKKHKLSDGRWTLAFPDGEGAKAAKEMIEGQREQLRANVQKALMPLFL